MAPLKERLRIREKWVILMYKYSSIYFLHIQAAGPLGVENQPCMGTAKWLNKWLKNGKSEKISENNLKQYDLKPVTG